MGGGEALGRVAGSVGWGMQAGGVSHTELARPGTWVDQGKVPQLSKGTKRVHSSSLIARCSWGV